MPAEARRLRSHFLGRRRYGPVWALQNALAQRLRDDAPDAREVLLFVEHEPVITIGRRGHPDDVLVPVDELARRGIDVHTVDRGGEVTYHGPGQLVVYPIVRLDPRRFGVGDLVRGLAGAIADVIGALGVATRYDPDAPGLWSAGAKICAVGMRVAGGVSTHGAALNVTTDLDAFALIVPCGQPRAPVTSLGRELSRLPAAQAPPGLPELADRVAERFAARFEFTLDREPAPAWLDGLAPLLLAPDPDAPGAK